jgi:hypothetical protein
MYAPLKRSDLEEPKIMNITLKAVVHHHIA